MATKKKPGAKRGRPPVPIEEDPQRFEVAAWWAFYEEGCGPFDAVQRALLAVKGGPFTVADMGGVLRVASATIPLPPFDPDDPDKGLRQLAAKAKRAKPERWLIFSSALLRALFKFIEDRNMTGVAWTFDGLIRLGWGPVALGLVDQIEAALKSNLAPADLAALGPKLRKQIEHLIGTPKRRRHRKK